MWAGQEQAALAMIDLRIVIRLAVFALTTAAIARGQDRDVAAEFKAAKAGLTSQIKDRKKETRLAAVAKLETFPTPDAAKLLLFQGLASKDEETSRAAFDSLAKFTSNKEVCDYLMTTVAKQWKQGKPQEETFAGIALLLASELPEIHEDALVLLRDAAERPNGRNILISLADALANCRGDSAAKPLIELMGVPFFEKDFAFRRAVAQALCSVRAKTAITALIKLLAKVKGEVRADIAKYLTSASGQQLGIDAAVWQNWWDQNEKTFQFPPEQKPVGTKNNPATPRVQMGGPSYYGLPISAAKIIFVIDTSASMRGPRIVAAKRELCRAIQDLPAAVEFNVIAFNGRSFHWQNKLVPASEDSKQSALYFVMGQNLDTGTASYDALETALRFDGEAIYFLTDGAPFGGKIVSPPEIIRAITHLNQFRRMTINSFGIGVGPPGNAFDSFLSTLADQNYGAYERVDQ
jgi:hypothetical protein